MNDDTNMILILANLKYLGIEFAESENDMKDLVYNIFSGYSGDLKIKFSIPEFINIEFKYEDMIINNSITYIDFFKKMMYELLVDNKSDLEKVKDHIKFYCKVRKGEYWDEEKGKANIERYLNTLKRLNNINSYEEV